MKILVAGSHGMIGLKGTAGSLGAVGAVCALCSSTGCVLDRRYPGIVARARFRVALAPARKHRSVRSMIKNRC
jgi:hypothetical protein